MGLFKNLIRGVNDIQPPSRGLREPISSIDFPPIRRMPMPVPMPAPMPIVPPSPLVPPLSIRDINRFERPPSFERIDEFIPGMPNEAPIPFVPPPPIQPILQQPPSPLAFEVAQRQNQIGVVGDGMTEPSLIGQEINAPVPLTEEEKAAFGPPPPPGAIDTRGITDELSNITNPVSPPPIAPPPINIGEPISRRVPGGGGIDYGPVELEPIERPIALPPINIGGPPLDTSLMPEREVLQRPTIPTRREDFMSIGGITEPGGGFTDNRVIEPKPFVPPQQPIFTTGEPIDPANRRVPINAPMPMPTPVPKPVTPPASTTVAANQPAPAPVVQPTTTDDPVVVEPPVEPGATTTTTNAGQAVNNPFAASVTQRQTTLDPITQQLLFGLDGQGGFIPGAMRAAEKTFYDDQGNPIVIDEQVAGFSPDQLAAMQMQRQSVGQQDPYLGTAADAYGAGTQALEEGLQRGRTAAIGSLAATRGGLGSLQQGLGESADILRGTVGGYDPSMTERFYDPYEDRVVQQTIQDVMEQGAKSDIGARAGDIARGGESAFGSRARLGASERQRAIGRGLAEALGGIRSQGFRQAQQTGLGEFARQKAAERAASSGLAGLAGQGFTGQQALAGALSGLGQTEQNIGQQRYSGQFGLGSSLQGLGAQAAGASASDIAALYGMGAQQQGQTQQMLDAQRRNLQQRQMTPLLQYQALQPFVSMAPAGQFQTDTSFVPAPSPVQAGMGVGLSAFGALGQLYGGKD